MKNQRYNDKFTLFLDRDGVINERLPAAYVRSWSEFSFAPGALDAIAVCSSIFGKIIIITNQQGIGKGLMTEEELQLVHNEMVNAIEKAGGRIDAIYHCPDLRAKPNNCRKPNPTMALRAKKDFPSIDFRKSVMVGDSISDMQFGMALGMETVFITSNQDEVQRLVEDEKALPNHIFHSLAQWLEKGV